MPHDEPPGVPGLGLPALAGLAPGAVAVAPGLPVRAQEAPAAVTDLAGIYTGRRCVTGAGEVGRGLSRAGAETMLTARARAFTEASDELAEGVKKAPRELELQDVPSGRPPIGRRSGVQRAAPTSRGRPPSDTGSWADGRP